jgi:hypothetical protein
MDKRPKFMFRLRICPIPIVRTPLHTCIENTNRGREVQLEKLGQAFVAS